MHHYLITISSTRKTVLPKNTSRLDSCVDKVWQEDRLGVDMVIKEVITIYYHTYSAFASLLVRTAQIINVVRGIRERKIQSEVAPENFLAKRKKSYLDLYIGISMKERYHVSNSLLFGLSCVAWPEPKTSQNAR